ncbi:glutaredoxin family protein [uncultured Corynebacterium sp.]|uniref:glutaredoxin family protein n=1 Tax=uncultured Corynebacterium sp. TaxID=159447 RepID=UPI00260543A2|nr:glutaredoxin family protein [uncultured Corynebacterium sp.]
MITVYGKPGCQSCRATRRVLAKQNTPFQYIDLAEHPEHMKHIRGLGYTALPVVTVTSPDGDLIDHWAEFRVERIKNIKGMEA